MSFPFVKQLDSMQCGIACLAMISRYFGKTYSIAGLSNYCFATNRGVSLKAIADAAGDIGLETAAARLSVNDLSKASLPAIIHWNQNHFVVLYRISPSGKTFYIADPGKGRTKFSRNEFIKHWISTGSDDGVDKGIAMFFEPDERFGTIEIEDRSAGRSFSFLIGYLKQYRHYYIQIFLGLMLGCLLQLMMPFLTQGIVDMGIRHNDIPLIWLILLGELMIVIGRTATGFIRRRLLLHISMRINISLVSDFFIKLMKLPMSYFDTKLMGDLLQRMNDHSRVQSFLTGQTLTVLFNLLSFIVFGIVLCVYSPLIFVVFLIGSIIYGAWIASFMNRRKVIDYELFEQQSANNNKTYQLITSMQEIKLQDCESRRRWEWEDVQADLFSVQMKSLSIQQTQEAGSIFINEMKNVIITVLAATAVINGQMTLGAMLAVQYIIGQLNSPVESMMSFIYSMQDVKISLERINDIHTLPDEDSGEDKCCGFNSPADLEIKLDNVSFKYDRHSDSRTIDNVTITIPEGKVTAIVGASGSGKTTLVKLMLGYYKALGGSISIAGRNISDYNLKWWRSQCGAVMQDGVIFSESIARNIAVDDDDINLERLEHAARIACIHDFIMGLPLKYDTIVGRDGHGLSQGQKQRILIARAVYKNPKFIFLDEATNSLDAANERAIVKNLDDFYKGRTVVVVAHRLSTVRNAANIIVLDHGRVVESGTHDALTNLKGVYYNLVKNQLELGN